MVFLVRGKVSAICTYNTVNYRVFILHNSYQ